MQLTIVMDSMVQDGTHVSKQHCADLPAQPKHLGPLVSGITLAVILLVRDTSGSQCLSSMHSLPSMLCQTANQRCTLQSIDILPAV